MLVLRTSSKHLTETKMKLQANLGRNGRTQIQFCITITPLVADLIHSNFWFSLYNIMICLLEKEFMGNWIGATISLDFLLLSLIVCERVNAEMSLSKTVLSQSQCLLSKIHFATVCNSPSLSVLTMVCICPVIQYDWKVIWIRTVVSTNMKHPWVPKRSYFFHK